MKKDVEITGITSEKNDITKTVFMFGGIASQWEMMAKELSEESIFCQTIDECDRCFRSYSGWSIREELEKGKELSLIHDPNVAPACICAVEIALSNLLVSWGIKPDAVIGHSIGEAVAAYVAGVISLSDVFKIIWHHSVIIPQIKWTGAMAHVSVTRERITELLNRYPKRLSVAAYNGPVSAVISGEKELIIEIVNQLSQEQIFCKILNTSIPFHTSIIEPYKNYVHKNLSDIQIMPMKIPIYSTLYGRLSKSSDYDAKYWADHIHKPVLFYDGIEALRQEGYVNFVEISPHSILTVSVKEAFAHADNSKCNVIPTLIRNEHGKKAILTAVARLACSGYTVQFGNFLAEDKAYIHRQTDSFSRRQDNLCWLSNINSEKLRKYLNDFVKSSIAEISDHIVIREDDENTNFMDLGIDSISAFRLWSMIASELDISPPINLIFEYPTLMKLVEYLMTQIWNVPATIRDRKRFNKYKEHFGVIDFIETQKNPLFNKLSKFHLCVTHQKNRKLTIEGMGGREFTDFASCNYLGLDYHPDVMASVPGLIEKWGSHPSWTRLVASPAPYFELEERLAEFVNAPYTLVFPCIAMLNFGTLPILAGPDGVILCDSAAHHTIQEACQLASAKGITCVYFRYNDLDDLEKQMKKYAHKSPMIVAVDGVYSMTAKYVNLPGYSEVAKKYGAYLFVDDAHGFGIIGENPTIEQPYGKKGNGIVNYFGMDYVEDRIIYITAMSKAFSSFAAFIVCLDKEMKEKLRLASTYVFSGPVPVASLASSLVGIDVNEKEGDNLRLRLYNLSEKLASGARTLGFKVDNQGGFPIIYVVTGEPEHTVNAMNMAWDRGLIVSPGIFPAVPINHGGLRFSVTALNTESEIDNALNVLEDIRKTIIH
ncbi:MAG: aminotransferase class I/II-fold pyridoxal phosphate-dependent enzyme [Desulfamplus sp.]|nr:aminotransferase class I/II-fold pyridoxal phosphate-dependent enzyme [Desulfamplus sp.]